MSHNCRSFTWSDYVVVSDTLGMMDELASALLMLDFGQHWPRSDTTLGWYHVTYYTVYNLS